MMKEVVIFFSFSSRFKDWICSPKRAWELRRKKDNKEDLQAKYYHCTLLTKNVVLFWYSDFSSSTVTLLVLYVFLEKKHYFSRIKSAF